MQFNAMSISERDYMDPKSDPELGEKVATETLNSPKTGEDGDPHGGQVPTKRTKLQTALLMTSLCVSFNHGID